LKKISTSIISYSREAKMHIVYGKKQAEALRDRYTVLELDTVTVKEKNTDLTLYAVVDTAKLSLDSLPKLENWTKLHEDFVIELNKNNTEYCLQAVDHLTGQFGGELDTFYQHVRERFND
jgi:hypothetical protein|tara:strand:- start:163 stop:522 length:360 start_codon:yes stop_codon:yes gene_type:complete